MPSKATIRIEGHAGGDAESRTTKSGKEYVSFSVAVSNGHKDPDTKEWVRDATSWYKVMCFFNKKSILESVRKGIGVVVVGSPKYSAYVSEKTGKTGIDLAIFANEVSILCYDKKESNGNYGDAAFYDDIETGIMDLDENSDAPDSDVPF
jgi:single-stranded DNA-binding protein